MYIVFTNERVRLTGNMLSELFIVYNICDMTVSYMSGRQLVEFINSIGISNVTNARFGSMSGSIYLDTYRSVCSYGRRITVDGWVFGGDMLPEYHGQVIKLYCCDGWLCLGVGLEGAVVGSYNIYDDVFTLRYIEKIDDMVVLHYQTHSTKLGVVLNDCMSVIGAYCYNFDSLKCGLSSDLGLWAAKKALFEGDGWWCRLITEE